MANRVVITICGEEYTLVADETSAYMQKVGSCVSDKMTEVMNDAKVGRTDAGRMSCSNLRPPPSSFGARSKAIWTRLPRLRPRSAS